MRTFSETNTEFNTFEPDQLELYVYDNYVGVHDYKLTTETSTLTVNVVYVEELNRMDLVGISPEIVRYIVKGEFSAGFIQENYPNSVGKTVYTDYVGHNVRQYDGLLRVYVD